jgi:ABC-type uncharacterized transport system permease subunit
MRLSAFLELSLIKATPLILAALGGLFSERVGVINIALEGMMLAGAFGAVIGAYFGGSPLIGLITAAVFGVLLAFIHGFTSITLRGNHIVSGVAINLLALSITGFLLYRVFGVHGTSPAAPKLEPVTASGLISFSPLFLFAVFLVFGSLFFLYRTPLGLRMRAVGENLEVARSLGIEVGRLQYLGVLISGALCGIAGAELSLVDLSQFVERMTGGRGFIALACLIIASWRPGRVLLFALFLGAADALADSLQLTSVPLPPEFFLALPFILTIIVLAGFVPGLRPPASLGKHLTEQ